MLNNLSPAMHGYFVVVVMVLSGLTLGTISDKLLSTVGVRDREG